MIKSASEFVRLRSSEIPEEYNRSASEEMPLSVWYEVIQDYPEMKKWAAHNKTVPIEILEILATDDDIDVRVTVARKRKLNHKLFENLAQDSDESVRMGIAVNQKTPKHILKSMINDDWSEIRETIQDRLSEI